MNEQKITLPWNKETLLQAWELIRNAHHITLLTHFKPDGDGMSACAAFESFIKTYDSKKEITTIYPSRPEQTVKHAPSKIYINSHEEVPNLLIAFDTANYDRLYYPSAFQSVPLIVIDHHVSNAMKGAYTFVDGSITSTCELLYLLMKEWAEPCITTLAAEAMMFGILTDTLTFSIQTIQSQTLRVAAELIDRGVSLYEIKQHAFQPKSPAIVSWWGDLMKSVQFSSNKKAAWIIVSQQDIQKANSSLQSLVGFNNFLAGLSDCDVIVVGYEMDDQSVKLSFRSKRTDVNALAKQFGGGGHIYASGALSKEPISLVREKIKNLCEAL